MTYARTAIRGYRGFGASDPSVVALQTNINSVMIANGGEPVTVDGIIGPATCAAALQTSNFDGGAVMSSAVSGNLCTAAGAPVKAAAKSISISKPASSSLAPAAPAQTILGMPMKTVAMVGLVGVALFVFMGSGPKKGK